MSIIRDCVIISAFIFFYQEKRKKNHLKPSATFPSLLNYNDNPLRAPGFMQRKVLTN